MPGRRQQQHAELVGPYSLTREKITSTKRTTITKKRMRSQWRRTKQWHLKMMQ